MIGFGGRRLLDRERSRALDRLGIDRSVRQPALDRESLDPDRRVLVNRAGVRLLLGHAHIR
jgi:hypothetical protein